MKGSAFWGNGNIEVWLWSECGVRVGEEWEYWQGRVLGVGREWEGSGSISKGECGSVGMGMQECGCSLLIAHLKENSVVL